MSDTGLDLLLDELKLSTMKRHYVSFAKEAEKTNKTMAGYLKALAQEEQAHRSDQRIKRLISQARFPVIKRVSDYQFAAFPTLNKGQILSLADCHFVDETRNLCLMGQTGTGKTHLATAIAYEACKKKIPTLFFSAAKLVFGDEKRKNCDLYRLLMLRFNGYPCLLPHYVEKWKSAC